MKTQNSTLLTFCLMLLLFTGCLFSQLAQAQQGRTVLMPIASGGMGITTFIPILPSSHSAKIEATNIDGSYHLRWSAVKGASYYQIIITDENNKQQIIKVTGTYYSLVGLTLGNNRVEIQACNASHQCGVGSLAGTISRKTKIRYQHTDMLGTPVVETDEAGHVISRSTYEPFGKRLGGEKAGIGYTGHLQDPDLGLTYMQARYYDPLIGRFYSNDPVDYLGHMQRGNLVHGFGRYTYANNNPYKYVDPDGEFGIIGALIGGGIDATIQIGNNMKNGKGFGDAVMNVDLGSVAVSAALGSVTGGATTLLKGAATGTTKVAGTTFQLTSKTERVVAGTMGASKAAAAGFIQAERKGKNGIQGAAAQVVNGVTSPVPVGTMVMEGASMLTGSEEQKSPPLEVEKDLE
ncbi:hypothetical protein TUM4438_44870 [Shewanella sairae]|uniref:Teneurin-like YD-shell domain-containing protein n=1 Tax=Shewanella sairae TaxID=190310 RepID=A0ABQ4PSP1_9GAMM|nr:RHS repeat-associated core domain-containing protein [Shewanella sairae]MCL1132553.1 hypothetical protein [Shewanella sairae]GIU52351.1 hypothetical protein TUM4438_44870 [Shewanella sairae]